ncbi:MAG: hypothetical protein K0S39_5030 [Paenibacillus sp.]|jgi:GNAT superfamily N-acetyltransferase|nr:hypothetical protein [Paenibacillus sp.]
MMNEIQCREVQPQDSETLIAVIDRWWGGSMQSDFLNKWFFVHFRNTCFVAEVGGTLAGFVVGFYSQAVPGEAYIRLVAVHPEYRGKGVARALYERFMQTAARDKMTLVRCVTSPRKKDSIAFHTRMGFSIEEQDTYAEGFPVFSNYDGRGGDRILFVKKLGV